MSKLNEIKVKNVLGCYTYLEEECEFPWKFLYNLTIDELEELYFKESEKRYVNIQLKLKPPVEEYIAELNVIYVQICDMLKTNKVEMCEEASGAGLGVRDYHFGFQSIVDKEKYEPLILKAFEPYEKM